MNKQIPCSTAAAVEPLAGTAPFARGWLILEHPVPWGRDALTQSELPSEVVSHILDAQAQGPLMFLAARRSGADGRRRPETGPRRVWLAHCAPEGGLVRTGMVTGPEGLLDIDLSQIANGHLPDFGEHVVASIEFVCTHSTRDACCAVHGRRRIATASPDVWECSHLGGHRFAATSLFLPSGRLYGRLGSWREPGEPEPEYLRGPSYLPAPLQAAECAVRIHAQISPDQALHVTEIQSLDEGPTVQARDTNGRSWTVECRWVMSQSPASCGGDPKPRYTWLATIIAEGI